MRIRLTSFRFYILSVRHSPTHTDTPDGGPRVVDVAEQRRLLLADRSEQRAEIIGALPREAPIVTQAAIRQQPPREGQ